MLKPIWRRQTLLYIAAALVMALATGGAFAQEARTGDAPQLINIEVKDAPIEQVLRMLAKYAQVNIVIGGDVKGTVPSVALHDVTVETALSSIAEAQGFFWYKRDNVYMVTTHPPAGVIGPGGQVLPTQGGMAQPAVPTTQPGVEPGAVQPGAGTATTGPAPVPGGGSLLDSGSARPPVVTQRPIQEPALAPPTSAPNGEPKILVTLIPLSFADSGQLALMFGGGVAEGSSVRTAWSNFLPGSGRSRGLSRSQSRRLQTPDIFQGGFGAPGGGGMDGLAQAGLGGIGGGGIGAGGMGGLGGAGAGGSSVLGTLLPESMSPPIAFLPENALLVQGTQEDIDQFREILALLDKPVKQVEIATKFIEVQTTADQALGIDWSLSNGSLEFFNSGFAPGEAVNNVVRFARGRFEAQLNALLSSGRATVINEPHVITQNNQYAEINFFTTIPYFTAQISYNQFGTREVDFTSDFIDVENSLWVVPRINADDSISVFLEPNLEDTVGEVEGPNGERIPIVTSQYVSTQVRVPDGETIVLGGLIRKDESTTLRETPLLSQIPIIGKLFRAKRVNKRNSELLIFVTPKIIRETPRQ